MGTGKTAAYVIAFTGLALAGCGRSPTAPQNANPTYSGVPNAKQYSNRDFLPEVYRRMQSGSIAGAENAMNLMKGYAAGNPDAREQFRAADAEMAGRPVPAYGMTVSSDNYGIPSLLKPRARLAKAGVQQASEGLPLSSVTNVYTKQPIMTVLRVENEDGTTDHYWTNPLIVANGTRELFAAKRAIFRPYPRIQVDGGPFYDIDTAMPIEELPLVLKSEEDGEDLMYILRNAVSGSKRFEPPINVFPYDNPPSSTTPDSVALGVIGWQEMTDLVTREMGIRNPFSVRVVRQRTLPIVNILYEGKRRIDDHPVPIGEFVSPETKRDANGIPVEAFVYINPKVSLKALKGVAAHEVGHSFGIYGGQGLSPYNGGHRRSTKSIMFSTPFVDKPSKLDALIIVTRYSLPQHYWPREIYADKDIQVKIPGTSPDFNGDGESNFDDFFLFAGGFGTSNAKFDLNNDGIAGFDDFFIFADAFGKKGEELKKYTVSESERQRLLDEQRSQHPAINRSVRR